MKWATTLLILCIGLLAALGAVMLYSASMAQFGSAYLCKQLIAGGIGLVLFGILFAVNYRRWLVWSWAAFGAALLLLALVLVPGIGTKVNGARRWLDLGFMNFQPSEMAKIAMIMALAAYGERCQRRMHRFVQGLVVPGLIIGAVAVLVFVEPDRGTTILLCGVGLAVLLVAGVRWWQVTPLALVTVVGLALAIWLDPIRRRRVLSWWHLEQSRHGAGYQVYESLLAFGSGGWTGLGLGNGRQKFGFVPEHHTDFILPIVGEELGLIATLGVVLAFIVLIICGAYIAAHARDQFGKLLGAGLTFAVGFQAFVNIAVVTDVLPNKGLPLPFISYGGSNLLCMFACMGLLLSIARHRAGLDSDSFAFPATDEITSTSLA